MDDVCSLGMYSLNLIATENDTANFGATAMVFSHLGEEVRIDVPSGVGWRSHLRSLIGADSANGYGKIDIGFSDGMALQVMLGDVILQDGQQYFVLLSGGYVAPVPASSVYGFALEVDVNSTDVPEHGLGLPAQLPILEIPDAQHVTFALCNSLFALE